MTSVHWRHFNRRVGKRALLGCMLVAAAVEMFWATSWRELERVRSPEPTAAPPAPASLEKAIAAHDGAGYQAALKVLGDGATRDFRIVEGAAY